jgi:alcohol dehydrogenase
MYELGKVPRILVGSEHLKNVSELVQGLSGESVVFVVDSAVAKSDYFKALRGFGLPSSTFVMPAGEPSVATVNAAAQLARESVQTVVVGIGGGSALDIAKQVAAVMASDKSIEHYLLCANPWYGRRPIIAIPTTSGTGAEVTRTCIVSNAEGRKMWTWGDELLPDVVILDPVATVSMPEWVTISTGLDAFVHALEAATSQRRNVISRGLALQAIRLVKTNLPLAVEEPQNLVWPLIIVERVLLTV